jgi:cytochrome c556
MRIVSVVIGIVAAAIAGVLVGRNAERDTPTDATAATETTPSTDTAEIIEARRVLMLQIDRLMKPIDAFTVEGKGDIPALQSAAGAIEAMILAFPHLFPPESNLYDASVRESPTTALPAVWEDQEAFRTFAQEAERSAAAIAGTDDAAALRAEAVALRGACDGCHAQFMKPYTPPRVTQEDRDFDFDSVFPGK